MKKPIISQLLLIAITLVFTFLSCNKDDKKNNPVNEDPAKEDTAKVDTGTNDYLGRYLYDSWLPDSTGSHKHKHLDTVIRVSVRKTLSEIIVDCDTLLPIGFSTKYPRNEEDEYSYGYYPPYIQRWKYKLVEDTLFYDFGYYPPDGSGFSNCSYVGIKQ
jgi:hypothetical protein